ncbi:hypothetical protein [Carboxylicivirga sp. RSCT41]|uniref:hypothetical protein n=1 Tax=Carboxylicivirga agarovorans TaxID=3417570 RepID=UPI003D334D5E
MKQEEAFDLLNDQLKDIPKAEIRSLSLAVLPRLMNVLDNNMAKCTHCKKFSNEGEAFVANIRPLFKQDIATIKRFDQWAEETQKHLKHTHQQHVKGRITSSFTTIGMLCGVSLGLLASLVNGTEMMIANASIGWAFGMLIGYSGGKLKENKLKLKNKLY